MPGFRGLAMDLNTFSQVMGISRGTISRVLNGHPSQRISEQTRQRIIEGARKYNYQPSSTARALSSRKTLNVAVVLHDLPTSGVLANPTYLPNFLVALERALQTHGYGLNLVTIDRANADASFAELVDRHRSFDALVFPTQIASPRMLEMVAMHNIPAAAYRDPRCLEWPVNYFHFDEQSDVHRSVEHLLEVGADQVAVIDWRPLTSGWQEDIVTATARRALQRAGAPVHEDWLISAGQLSDPFVTHRAYGRAAMDQLLDAGHRPNGVLAFNDMVAFGILDSIRAHNLRPGRDVAVVGHGNIEGRSSHGTEGYNPMLTTFSIALDDICQAMATALLDQIGNPGLPIQQKLFPSELIIRESTRVDS